MTNQGLSKPHGVYREWQVRLGMVPLGLRIVTEASYYYERGKGGIFYKTQSDLADRYGVSERGLRKALSSLKETGLIIVSKGLITPSKKTIKMSNLTHTNRGGEAWNWNSQGENEQEGGKNRNSSS